MTEQKQTVIDDIMADISEHFYWWADTVIYEILTKHLTPKKPEQVDKTVDQCSFEELCTEWVQPKKPEQVDIEKIKAEQILAEADNWEWISCTCFQNPPCSKCINCPPEEDIIWAEKILKKQPQAQSPVQEVSQWEYEFIQNS